MLSDFLYKASIIIPVYNVEKYVAKCIDSVIAQTMDMSLTEVILVNDGSTDSSCEICKEYADKYDNIFLYSKDNEGLSKTRNFGIDKARGKYIFYLDSDDTLSRETVKEVTDFFDSVYDSVDLVTYRITQYYNQRPAVVHYRYKILTKSGIYDLNESKNRFITQTNINICVKNMGKENIMFDISPDFRHEDEKYCCDVLSEKMKIGFCSKGEYIYNRNNIDSIVSTQFSPEKIFESSMEFYEGLFSRYKTGVPPYFQGIVFNDLRWKLMDEKLFPTHYSGEKWIEANNRIDALLDKIDEDTIVLHPSVNEFNLHFWLMRRRYSFPAVITKDDGIYVCVGGRRLLFERKIKKTVIEKKDGVVIVQLVSPVFFHLKSYSVKIVANGKCEQISTFTYDMANSKVCKPLSDYLPVYEYEECEGIKMFLTVGSHEYPII